MKKLLLLALLAVMGVTLVGCGKEEIKLNLDKVKEDLTNVTEDAFYLLGVPEVVECEKCDIFTDMANIYDTDFKKTFGLTSANIEKYLVKLNKKNKDMYMILQPKKDKKDAIIKEIDAYFTKSKISKMTKYEYEGYLVYIVSKDNDKVFDLMKTSKETIFGSMMEVTKDNMKDVLNLDPTLVDEFLMKIPMMNVQSNTYIIAKPAQGKEKEVKAALDAYMLKLEEQWKTYLPDQLELVQNRKVEKVGDYLVYIISNNNDKVFNTIKNNK